MDMRKEKYLYRIKNNMQPKMLNYAFYRWTIVESLYSRTKI